MRKKGIVSLNVYSLLLILYVLIFFTSYWYYSSSKISYEDASLEIENINSGMNLRGDLLEMIVKNNTYLNYVNEYDSENIVFELNSSIIGVVQHGAEKKVSNNISMFGVEFCSNYTKYPVVETTFHYNGSCIAIITG